MLKNQTPPIFTTPKAAEALGVKPATLEVWRCQGRGPVFVKLGRAVRYRQCDLDDFINRGLRCSTSDAV